MASAETVPHTVVIGVSVHDGTGSAPLAGAHVSVIEVGGDEAPVASGISAIDGSLELEVDGTADFYIAFAEWPGDRGDLEEPAIGQAEFVVSHDEPVEVLLWGSHGAVAGSIAATVDGAPLLDLSDAMIEIASAGVTVQRLPLAADGSFFSAALPTSSALSTSVSLVPPAGFSLAAVQPAPNASFAVPFGGSSPSVVAIERTFALTASGAPAPVPSESPVPTASPVPSASPMPTPDPTEPPVEPTPDPTEPPVEPTPDPTEPPVEPTEPPVEPTPAPPVPSAAQLVIGDAESLGDLFAGGSESAAQAMLDALFERSPASDGAPEVAAWFVDDQGAAVGLALTDPSAIAAAYQQFFARAPEATGLSLWILDSSALHDAATLADAADLQAVLDALAAGGVQLGLEADAEAALAAYVASPTPEGLAAAARELLAAGVDDSLLNAAPEDRIAMAREQAAALAAQLEASRASQEGEMAELERILTEDAQANALLAAHERRLAAVSSDVVGTMRSEPTPLGTVRWDRGSVTGAFDFADVPAGAHHLILEFAEVGAIAIQPVTIGTGSPAELPRTGATASQALGVGLGLLVLGLVALIAPRLVRANRMGATG